MKREMEDRIYTTTTVLSYSYWSFAIFIDVIKYRPKAKSTEKNNNSTSFQVRRRQSIRNPDIAAAKNLEKHAHESVYIRYSKRGTHGNGSRNKKAAYVEVSIG